MSLVVEFYRVDLDLRVGDDDRERIVGTLQRHAQAGRLDPFELDERLEAALSAKTFRELQRLTADLPTRRARPRRARRKVGELREHLGFWLTVSTICVAVWARPARTTSGRCGRSASSASRWCCTRSSCSKVRLVVPGVERPAIKALALDEVVAALLEDRDAGVHVAHAVERRQVRG